MLRTTRCGPAFAVAAVVLFVGSTALAGRSRADETAGDPEDSHRLLWEPKQRAFERLQQAMALPPDADRASQDDHDVTFHDIDISISPTSETISGVVTMRATSIIDGLATVILNLYDNMTATSVTGNPSPLSCTHADDKITLTLDPALDTGETFEVTVEYNGSPSGYAFRFNYHGKTDAPVRERESGNPASGIPRFAFQKARGAC